MALTKVTGQVIKNTTDVTVGVLTVTNTLAVGGTVSIGGTLTYEDVTNVDAVGLITARNGIVVGSGITLSKDGDGFFTGIVTATSFSGSGANLTGIDTDLVSDTSPQLGGNLDVNTKNIVFGDSGSASDDRLTFGAGTDLSIYHDGTHTYLNNITGNLRIQNNGTVKSAQFEVDQVDFNDSANSTVHVRKEPAGNFKIFKNLNVVGVTTTGSLESSGAISGTTGTFSSHVSLGDGDELRIGDGSDLEIYHNGTASFIKNTTGGLNLEDTGGYFRIKSDDIKLEAANGEDFLECDANGAVTLYHNGTEKFSTQTYGIAVDGVVSFTKDTADDTTSTIQVNGAAMNSDDYLYIMSAANNSINGLTMFLNGSTRGSDGGNNGLTIRNDNGPMNVGLNGATHSNFFYTGAAGGIDFSGTANSGGTMSSELLDDYEEGTWTPTASGFTINNNYSANYTKIGNVVYVQMYIVASGGSGVSAISIGGLPYTIKAGNYYSYAAGRIGGSASSGYDKVFEFINSSTNVQPKVADGPINEGMISGQHLIFSGFYHAA